MILLENGMLRGSSSCASASWVRFMVRVEIDQQVHRLSDAWSKTQIVLREQSFDLLLRVPVTAATVN